MSHFIWLATTAALIVYSPCYTHVQTFSDECVGLVVPLTEGGCSTGVDCEVGGECGNGRVCCMVADCPRAQCLPRLPPPPPVDWTHETATAFLSHSSSPSFQHLSKQEEAVLIKGGCLITKTQMKTLEEFSNNTHVQSCFCDSNTGGIYCRIAR